MKVGLLNNSFKIEMTIEEFAAMYTASYRLYVTPSTDGVTLTNLYWSGKPNFINDFSILSPEGFFQIATDFHYDFAEDVFSYEYLEEYGNDILTVEMPSNSSRHGS